MSSDSGSPIAQRKSQTLDLPRLLHLRARRVRVEAPKLEHFESSLSRYEEAVEFVVETAGEVPARAYGPALFVGEVEVDNSERTGERTWRLLSFHPERLEPGAPISWGWMKDPEEMRQRTEFRYEGEGGPATAE